MRSEQSKGRGRSPSWIVAAQAPARVSPTPDQRFTLRNGNSSHPIAIELDGRNLAHGLLLKLWFSTVIQAVRHHARRQEAAADATYPGSIVGTRLARIFSVIQAGGD